MPSIISKVLHPSYPGGKKPNPYTNPHHPNHNPGPSSTFATPWKCKQQSQQQQSTTNRRTSLDGSADLLAEARQSAGRDPITGNLVPRLKNPLLRLPAHRRIHLQRVRPAPTVGLKERERARTEDGSAYNNTIAGRRVTSGTKYDLFVQEMKEKQKVALGQSMTGYYAPAPRPPVEYYTPGRDGSSV